MSDHLAEALRLIDVSCEPGLEDRQDDQFETATLATAQIHATLEVAEHVEFAGEQLRRLADGVEALVEVLTEERRRVAQIVCAAHPGFTHTIILDVAEPAVEDDGPPLPRCGSAMNPGSDGPVCALEAGHSEYHADGHGNRWEP